MAAEPAVPRKDRREYDFSHELAERGWYHSFELPDGTKIDGYIPLDHLRARYRQFPLPDDLRGKTVLDIGAWDGWFSFEAERHGAKVTAVDCVDVPNFLQLHQTLHSSVEYRILDVYDLPRASLGAFDFVFFLGVLYHLKHPLLALEIVCSLTTDVALVHSFVTDSETWQEHQSQIPTMEFYETDELGNQMDNWFGPSLSCLMALCRAAGFARVELLHSGGAFAAVACHRKWEPVPTQLEEQPPDLLAVTNARTYDCNFSSQKEEYLTCWFASPRIALRRDELRFEVGGFGVPALFVTSNVPGRWQANFRLAPGLRTGLHDARLRFVSSEFGRVHQIAVS